MRLFDAIKDDIRPQSKMKTFAVPGAYAVEALTSAIHTGGLNAAAVASALSAQPTPVLDQDYRVQT